MSEIDVLTAAVNNMTKEQARTWLRKVMGAPRRALTGQEYDDIMLLLKLATPFNTSNNQRTETDEYRLAGKLYHVTYGFGDKPELEEVEEE